MFTGFSHKEILENNIEDFAKVSFKNVFNYLGTDKVALLCKVNGESIDERVTEFRPATNNLDAYLGSMWYGYLKINGKTIKAIETQNASPIGYWVSNYDYALVLSDDENKRMKELVDKILEGGTVNIAGNKAGYYLAISKDKDGYKTSFVSPDPTMGQAVYLSEKSFGEIATLFMSLENELRNRKKFTKGEKYFVIRPNGMITGITFEPTDSGDMSRLYMGNAFKTEKEAEENKEAIMSKYKALEDKLM